MATAQTQPNLPPFLPPRWFQLPDRALYHKARTAWQQSRKLYNVVAAGRRSFKTETAKRKVARLALSIPGNYFFAAPTRGQVKKIAWQDLKDLTRPFWAKETNESDLIIYLASGSTIHCIGLDAPARIEGQLWHGGILDEYGNMKPEVWPHHVQPVTADTRAWVDFIGVPEGRNHYYELAEYARSSGDPDWAFFTWKSADVLPASVIEAAQRQLDERTFRQEYEASFEGAGDTVYYAFSDANIVSQPFSKDAATVMFWDFNASRDKPMATGLVQTINGIDYVTKEFVHKNTNTEQQCQAVNDFLEAQGFSGELAVTGDYMGTRSESSASRSDYAIIETHFRHYRNYDRKIRPTLAVKDRVVSLNARFCSASGERRLFVDKRCVKLIADLRKVMWKESGTGIDGTNPELSHISDALTYWAYNYHPFDRKAIIAR